jgi:phage shock protein A
MGTTPSINEIRTAIRELTARAELALKEGRPDDAAELEERVARYRDELAARP